MIKEYGNTLKISIWSRMKASAVSKREKGWKKKDLPKTPVEGVFRFKHYDD